jgi:type I restriction enzyme M protein
MTRISQQQLESYLWGAATLLRGTIDAGDYKQFIFPLLFYKRLCDVHSEETQAALAESGGDLAFAAFAEIHRFQIPAESHWREVRQTARDVGQALQSAMRAIEIGNPTKLYGIFGDAQWTNKDRLSDAMLRDLIEHFSSLDLSIANLPEDELGQGYEYLIKKFADDSGHTAAEFYTNRTVVHLMTELLEPQPGESIYDPTCGSGGMLLSAVTHLRRRGKEWRNVRLYGQERNLMTSSIARMNCFLHGIEDFRIERGDTLAEPKLVEGDRLMQFDVVLANPPYSIKQWNREAFGSDPWGRNTLGVPPQGRADYAFWQHILASLTQDKGRCAILFPHGVLFRREEAEMRRKLIQADLIECVIGLGPNLFYNSPMEACVVFCRTVKPVERRGRILFINAVNEVTRERAQSFLTYEHIERIVKTYEDFSDEAGFCSVAAMEDLSRHEWNLSIPLYVSGSTVSTDTQTNSAAPDLAGALSNWLEGSRIVRESLATIRFGNDDASLDVVRHGTNRDWAALPLFDRSDWTRVRFGDVVRMMKEQVDPVAEGVERYVAGEHMETENVHIRRWGIVGDGYLGPAFIRRFRKGQVLYGSRRTYLKKVALAEWDGVTANTTFVLEADSGKLLQELLPWLMLSERFTRYSIQESKGSTNPYINFPDIAKFEFNLPQLDQQERIAEMLWAIDDCIDQYQSLLRSAERYKAIVIDDLFSQTHAHKIKLSDLCGSSGIRIGPFGSALHAYDYVTEGTPVVMPTNLQTDEIVTAGLQKISDDKSNELSAYRLEEGDVLIPRRGDLKKRGYVKPDEIGWICGTGTIRIRMVDAESQRLLFYALSRPSVISWLERNAVGTTMPNLNTKIVSNIEVYWPSDTTRALTFIQNIDTAIRHISTQIKGTKEMALVFLNNMFSANQVLE